MMSRIVELTAAQLSACLTKRELTSAEITSAYLKEIEERNPSVNAYVTVAGESAAKTAEHSDHARADHPLAGIPYALKDNFAAPGVRMTCASRVLADFVPEYACAVYEKLNGIGCPMLGKTNMDEFAMGSSTERSSSVRPGIRWIRRDLRAVPPADLRRLWHP